MSQNIIIDIAKGLGAFSLVINKNGQNIIEYGDSHDIFNIASIRKCFLSALYGIRATEGKIDLKVSLSDLNIDDNEPSLSEEEKQATIEDLLKLRSGVYHPANYETASTKAERPQRGSHVHNTFWYYNNWDANVLGTIYKKLVNKDIFQDFKELIADPIGMHDFDINKCEYKLPDVNSIHSAYVFRMSAQDLSMFGLLYLNKGNWNKNQIIPKDWIDKSLNCYSIIPSGNGFGYLWEVSADRKLYGVNVGNGAFSYSGYPGHFIVGIPDKSIVVTYTHNLEIPGKKFVSNEDFAKLLSAIVVS